MTCDPTTNSLDQRRRHLLLQIVRDGGGKRDARSIDIQMSMRVPPSDQTVLAELRLLEAEGKLRQTFENAAKSGVWQLTETGRNELEGC